MTEFVLSAARRNVVGKRIQSLRKQGKIPAVLYGHGVENQNLELESQRFVKLYQQAGASSLVDLAIDQSTPVKVLIHDIDRDPVTDQVIHVDFYQVNMSEKIEAEIQLVFTGVAPAVKELGGILVKNKTALKVKCLPGELVHEIDIDISHLAAFNQSIHVKDLPVPASYEVLDQLDEVVILVAEPRSEAELASLDEEVKTDVETVEVVGAKEKEAKAAEEAAAEGEAKPGEAEKKDK